MIVQPAFKTTQQMRPAELVDCHVKEMAMLYSPAARLRAYAPSIYTRNADDSIDNNNSTFLFF
jgi:hypothetical protein